MIHFFRRIRQKLLIQNRLTRYLIYAIGEIALVMIGILLALQVNNWNEKRKAATFELQLLHSFKAGLEQDLNDIQVNKRWHRRGLEATDDILALLESDDAHDPDEVASLFFQTMVPTYFQYSTSAFETLKSNGINTISNEELRDQIIGVYDSQYNFFLSNQEMHVAEIERGYTQILPLRFEESHKDALHAEGGKLYPLDFEALKTDQEFLFFLKSLKNRTILLLDYQYDRLEGRITNLIAGIDNEIYEREQ